MAQRVFTIEYQNKVTIQKTSTRALHAVEDVHNVRIYTKLLITSNLNHTRL